MSNYGSKNSPYGVIGLDINGLAPIDTLPIATVGTNGIGQPDGSTLDVDANGVWSAIGGGGYTLPAATTTVLGGVKVPTLGNLNVDGTGNISVPIATTAILGVVIPDNTTITIDGNGVISSSGTPLTPATTTTLGGVIVTQTPSIGQASLNVDGSGNLTENISSPNQLGVVKIDGNTLSENIIPTFSTTVSAGNGTTGINNFSRNNNEYFVVANTTDSTFQLYQNIGGVISSLQIVPAIANISGNTSPMNIAFFVDSIANILYMAITLVQSQQAVVFAFDDGTGLFETTYTTFVGAPAAPFYDVTVSYFSGIPYIIFVDVDSPGAVHVYAWISATTSLGFVYSFSSGGNVPSTILSFVDPADPTINLISVCNTQSNNFTTFSITTSAATLLSTTTTGAFPFDIDNIIANGTIYMAVICQTPQTVQVFSLIDIFSGFNSSAISSVSTGNTPQGVIMYSVLGLIYVTVCNGVSNTISTYLSNYGLLTQIGTPISTVGTNPAYVITQEVDGITYLINANANSSNISQYNLALTGYTSVNPNVYGIPRFATLYNVTLPPAADTAINFIYDTPFNSFSWIPEPTFYNSGGNFAEATYCVTSYSLTGCTVTVSIPIGGAQYIVTAQVRADGY